MIVNLKATATNGFANVSALTIASVENLVITLDDSDATAATTMFDFNMDIANAQNVTVSGDAGITFANGTCKCNIHGCLWCYSYWCSWCSYFYGYFYLKYIHKGGAGNDALVGGNAADTIEGNAGTDAITGGTGADNINGGAGVDTITITMEVSAGDTITGGAGNDIFQTNNTTAATITAPKITDMDLELLQQPQIQLICILQCSKAYNNY